MSSPIAAPQQLKEKKPRKPRVYKPKAKPADTPSQVAVIASPAREEKVKQSRKKRSPVAVDATADASPAAPATPKVRKPRTKKVVTIDESKNTAQEHISAKDIRQQGSENNALDAIPSSNTPPIDATSNILDEQIITQLKAMWSEVATKARSKGLNLIFV